MGNSIATKSTPEIYVFKIGNTKFILTSEDVNQSDVENSGIVKVLRGEGFKDVPPEVPRDEEGCIILTRNPDHFELLISHIKGGCPLNDCKLKDFDSKFENLFNEILYWNMPISGINVPLRLWTDSSWIDGKSLFPLSEKMLKYEKELPNFVHIIKLKKVPQIETFVDNLSNLIKDPEHGTFLTGVYGSDLKIEMYADSKLLLVSIPDFNKNFLMQFGDYDLEKIKNKKIKFSSFVLHPTANVFIIVLTPGIFVHIFFDNETKKSECVTYRREERWICVHPLSGLVISGISPGVPFVYCFDMPEEISVVKFFPWGAAAIYKNVQLTSKKTIRGKKEEGKKEEGKKEELSEEEKNLINNFEGYSMGNILTSTPQDYSLPIPKCAAKIFRKNNDANISNYFKLYFANTSQKADNVIKLSHIKDFDLVDRKLSDGTFICYCMVNGGLVTVKSDSTGGSDLIALNEGSLDERQKCILIKTGCPKNETLTNFFSFAEFVAGEEKYYFNSVCLKLLEIRQKGNVKKETWDLCTIM